MVLPDPGYSRVAGRTRDVQDTRLCHLNTKQQTTLLHDRGPITADATANRLIDATGGGSTNLFPDSGTRNHPLRPTPNRTPSPASDAPAFVALPLPNEPERLGATSCTATPPRPASSAAHAAGDRSCRICLRSSALASASGSRSRYPVRAPRQSSSHRRLRVRSAPQPTPRT